MLTLTQIVYRNLRSILAREFHYGTRPLSFGNCSLVPLCGLCDLCLIPIFIGDHSRLHPVRPRTSVLNLPIPLRHRFFSQPRSHFPRDCPTSSPGLPSSDHSLVHILRRSTPRVSLDPSRRHPRHHAHRARRRLLLQMRSIQNKSGLYKNV